MAFTPWNPRHLAKFNSATSAEFIDLYENKVKEDLREELSEPSHQTFAGSAFRCDRKSWFRLRGTQPDVPKEPDLVQNFTADMGTACHRIIQSNLKDLFGNDWLDVGEYLKSDPNDFIGEYEVEQAGDGFESQIHIYKPPIMFACDGLIRWKDKIYLLEIKTSEFTSWNEMTDPKPQHVDQVKCYATLLNIHDVLFLYQERQYGGFKCYEVHIQDYEMQAVKDRFTYVMDMVDKNLAPEGLPKNDPWCSPNQCLYYKKCSEYGR